LDITRTVNDEYRVQLLGTSMRTVPLTDCLFDL